MGDEPELYDDALPGAQTELAPSQDVTAASIAWAFDETPEWKPPFWTTGRITAAAVVGAVVVVVAVAGLVGYHLRPAPEPAPVPVVTIAAPPPVEVAPPKTVTVTPIPVKTVRPVSSYWTATMDANLVAGLAAKGRKQFDATMAIAKAREACATIDEQHLSVGEMIDRFSIEAAAEGVVDPHQAAEDMVYAAMDAYEPCFRR